VIIGAVKLVDARAAGTNLGSGRSAAGKAVTVSSCPT
jgi:hypothetical protein